MIPLKPRDILELGIRRSEPKGGDFRFHLPLFWRKDDQSWDVVPRMSLEERIRDIESDDFLEPLAKPVVLEDLLPKISELVVDAVEKVEVYALPYLLDVERSEGASSEARGLL